MSQTETPNQGASVTPDEALNNVSVLPQEQLPDGPSAQDVDDANAQIDAALNALTADYDGVQDSAPAEPAPAEQPAAQEPEQPQETLEGEPAEGTVVPDEPQADPRDARMRELEDQNRQMLDTLRKMVEREQPKHQPAPEPKVDAVARFAETMKKAGLNIDKPEVIEAQHKAQQAFFQSEFGMSPSELRQMLVGHQDALRRMNESQSESADQAKTLNAIAQAKAKLGVDFLGADKSHLADVVKKLSESGAAITYTQNAVIPPDVAVELAHYRKLMADQRAAAEKAAKAQAGKKSAQSVAAGAAPAAAPAAATTAKGLKDGRPLTQEEVNGMELGDLLDRLGMV